MIAFQLCSNFPQWSNLVKTDESWYSLRHFCAFYFPAQGATQKSSTTASLWRLNARASPRRTAQSSTHPSPHTGNPPSQKSPGVGWSSNEALKPACALVQKGAKYPKS